MTRLVIEVERLYDTTVGNRNLQREVTRARASYIGAFQQLARAMTAFNEAHVPLEPDDDGRLAPWTRDHVQIMRACAEAWPRVMEARRQSDALLRDLVRPAARPYA